MPRNDNPLTDDKTDPSIDEEAYEDRGCVADKSLERIMTRMILPQEEEDEMTNEVRAYQRLLLVDVYSLVGCFTLP